MERDPEWLLNIMWMSKDTFHCIMPLICKTVVSEWHQTLVSTRASHCILVIWLFGVASWHLLFWVLSFLKNFFLYLAWKTVQSLQHGISRFCMTVLCLHCRKNMRYCQHFKCFYMYLYLAVSFLFQYIVFTILWFPSFHILYLFKCNFILLTK